MKKSCIFFFTILLLFCTISVSACETAENDEPQYLSQKTLSEKTDNFDLLVSYGYSEDFLSKLTDTAYENLLFSVSGYEISDVSIEVLYLPDNTAENAEIILQRVTAVLKDADSSKIMGEAICLYWEWTDTPPVIREEDQISVQWNKDLFCYEADSFYAEDYSKDSADDPWTVSQSYTTLAHVNNNSLGHWTDLEAFDDYLGGVMIFNLSATSPLDADSAYNDRVHIEYTHEAETLRAVLYFAVPLVVVAGIVLTVIFMIRKKKKNKSIHSGRMTDN